MKKSQSLAKTTKKVGKDIITFPAKLLAPISKFLQDNIKRLESRKSVLSHDDPFEDGNRILDNASPDADAAEQFGHIKTTAVKDQLDKKLIQTKRALARLKKGKYGICEDCGNMIDTDRLTIYPEATLCIKCERKRE